MIITRQRARERTAAFALAAVKVTYDEAMTIHPPSIHLNHLRWHLREPDFPLVTFIVKASTFKYALDLRPRALEDEKLAVRIAERNWDVLDAIGREAMTRPEGVTVEDYKMRELKHRISDDLFEELFDKYESWLIG